MKFNKAMVTSLKGEFESYLIENVISVQFANGTLTLTYIDKKTMTTKHNEYSSNDVMINIA